MDAETRLLRAPGEKAERAGLWLPALVFGFGTAAAMWLVGFMCRLPAIQAPPLLLGVLLLGVPVVSGISLGRRVGAGALWCAAMAGLVTSVINLLVVGAVAAKDAGGNELREGWVWIVLGALVVGVVTSCIGAMIAGARGARAGGEPGTNADWLGRFAMVTALSAIPVLLSGGLVTSTNAGLAVPDWPRSYGAHMFLYPIAKMTGGIYYEHAHRLFGSLVGLTTLVFMLLSFALDRRGWVRLLAVVAFLFVCGQGVLGGIRVVSATGAGGAEATSAITDNTRSLTLAMVHGITAQVFFGYLCGLWARLSGAWRISVRPETPDGALRGLSTALVCVLLLQLGLGSATRHLHHAHALMAHISVALIVLVLGAGAAFRAIGRHRAEPAIRRLGHAVLHSLMLQVLLGVCTVIAVLPYEAGKVDPPGAVVLATAHQAVGAMLLGASVMLAVWARRRPADAS